MHEESSVVITNHLLFSAMQRHRFSFTPVLTHLFAISELAIPTPLTTLNKLSPVLLIHPIEFLPIFATTLRIAGNVEVRPVNVKGSAHAE